MSTLTLSAVRQNLSKFDYAGLGLPAMVLLIMAMLVIPSAPLVVGHSVYLQHWLQLVGHHDCHWHPQAA